MSRNYPQAEHAALNDLSLSVAAGEWVFLVGASGMGKTTLLKLIYREELADSGRVIVGGDDVSVVPGSRRRISVSKTIDEEPPLGGSITRGCGTDRLGLRRVMTIGDPPPAQVGVSVS